MWNLKHNMIISNADNIVYCSTGGVLMKNEKRKFIKWVKDHKTKLVIVGVSVTAIIGLIIGYKNREAMVELWDDLARKIKKDADKIPTSSIVRSESASVIEELSTNSVYKASMDPIEVKAHVRNLSEGRQHSVEKAAEAAKLGIQLLPNQTYVGSYRKYTA